MFSENPKDPALIISGFRKQSNGEKPVLKAAFINGDVFVGDNQLKNLTQIKTKDELVGEVIGLLLSPIQRVIGALQNKPEGKVEATAAVAKATTEAEAPAAEAPAAEAPAAEAPATDAATTDAPEANADDASKSE